jgi:hypothetical protein
LEGRLKIFRIKNYIKREGKMKKGIAVMLALFVLYLPPCMGGNIPLWPENSPGSFAEKLVFKWDDQTVESQDSTREKEQESWRKELGKAKRQRTLFLGAGISVLAVSVGFSVAGAVDEANASKDGVNLDQGRLDEARKKEKIGRILFLAGTVLGAVSGIKRVKVKRLKRTGKERGYSVSLDFEEEKPTVRLARIRAGCR